MKFLLWLIDWGSNILSGLTNSSRLSEIMDDEQRRQRGNRAKSELLAKQWEHEDELKRQRGIGPPPPDWRS